MAWRKFHNSVQEAETFSPPTENGSVLWWRVIRLGLPAACKLMHINSSAGREGKASWCQRLVRGAEVQLLHSPLVVWKVQQHEPGRAVVHQATLTKGYTPCQPSSWRGRRADSQSGSPMFRFKRMAWHGGPLVAPPLLSCCTAAA